MRISIQKYLRFQKKSRSEKVLILKLLGYFFIVRILVFCIPLKYYYTYFFEKQKLTELEVQPIMGELGYLKRKLRAFPMKVTCLTETMTIKLYFKKRGINLPTFIGVGVDDQLTAHAWCLGFEENGYTKI